MPIEITGLYACALALIMIVLGARVSIMRAKTDIPLLHGDNIALVERIRQHANFTENVPMALILMGIVEASGGSCRLAPYHRRHTADQPYRSSIRHQG